MASSHHAPPDLRAELARDPDTEVRSWVARNGTTPCDLLRHLARDTDETVRGWVAVNPVVPGDVMAQLADDPSDTVRALVAWKASLAEPESAAQVPVDA